MTLNEAIEHYDSLAEECRRKASIERNDYMDLRDESAEYSQLSDWLAELAVLREKVNCSELTNSLEPNQYGSGFNPCINQENQHDRTTDDPISRQDALDIVDDLNSPDWYMKWGAEARKRLVDLPAVKSKTGHWTKKPILSNEEESGDEPFHLCIYDCSECGGSMFGAPTKFCPFCGAKMEGDVNDDPE